MGGAELRDDDDLADLHSTAAEAWQDAPARARSTSFTWHGINYLVSHTGFRLAITTADGTKVECRPG